MQTSTPPFHDLPEPPRFDALPLTGDALFDRAIRVVFLHEGLWSDDQGDPGGPTHYGVSLAFALTVGDRDGDGRLDLDFDGDGDVDADDLRRMTAAQAVAVYRSAWWERYGYGRMPLPMAVKVFDLAVNMGAPQAHKCLQRALRACTGIAVADDGVIGPVTLAGIKQSEQHPLLSALRSEAAGVYRQIAASHPERQRFLAGWLNRAYD